MTKVICADYLGNKFEVDARELIFRPSVYAVIIHEGKVLLSKMFGDGYDFPGGGIERGETIPQALIREVKEETGYDVEVGKLLSVETNFFKHTFDGKFYQTILLFYAARVMGGEISTAHFDENEKTYLNPAEWLALKDIHKLKFYNAMDNVKIIKEAKLV